MPTIKSAKKALRQSNRRRARNRKGRDALRDIAKELRALAKANKKTEAAKLVSRAYQLFDKAAKGGVIKPRAAARHKSRLSKLTHG